MIFPFVYKQRWIEQVAMPANPKDFPEEIQQIFQEPDSSFTAQCSYVSRTVQAISRALEVDKCFWLMPDLLDYFALEMKVDWIVWVGQRVSTVE